MRIFIKYFSIGFGIQAALIGLDLLTGIGDYFVAMLYGLAAFAIYATGIQVPRFNGNTPTFFILLIPATLYSIVIGLSANIIETFWRRIISKGRIK
jgi:hypothetical protein